MKSFTEEPGAGTKGVPSHARSGRLFRKYATIFVAAVCLALVTNGAFDKLYTPPQNLFVFFNVNGGASKGNKAKLDQILKGFPNAKVQNRDPSRFEITTEETFLGRGGL